MKHILVPAIIGIVAGAAWTQHVPEDIAQSLQTPQDAMVYVGFLMGQESGLEQREAQVEALVAELSACRDAAQDTSDMVTELNNAKLLIMQLRVKVQEQAALLEGWPE